jgi:phosphoribosylformimino-5-aminoimidazole carboxamide ribotide isomerase
VADFDIIPVIDLKGGLAVRAAGGNRADYRPLVTPLCPDGDPLTAAGGLLGVCSARRLYIADLDSIEGGAPQHGAIGRIAEAHPGIALWVDDGFASPGAINAWPLAGLAQPVLGSESLGADMEPIPAAAILSLDFRADHFLGPRRLLSEPHLWPDIVIVMCLHSVGASAGPDLARLTRIVGMAGLARRVYAAGGVRGLADLHALADIGAAGALIASALHGGQITRTDLDGIAGRQM